jgi:HEAT repeat protein
MRSTRWPFVAAALLLGALARPAGADPAPPAGDDVKLLHAAGLSSDGAALLEFFRTRTRLEADRDRLTALVRRLGDPTPEAQARASAELVAQGVAAVPWLRQGVNDLESPDVARRAQRCLHWIDGPTGAGLTAAAVRVLALRRPAGAAEALLAYLPFADDPAVAEALRGALAALAFAGGRPEPALLRGLEDPVPVRRAVAGEALCRADRPEQLPAVRKLLHDAKPAVRLRAALALAKQQDAEAVPVLIDLLAELPPEPRKQVEDVLLDLAGDWAPGVALPGDDDISRRIRRDVWAAWWRNTDGPSLLAEFRKRTLTAEGEASARALVRKLGDGDFSVRERASDELAALGTRALPLLRAAAKDPDPEVARRAEACVERIEKGEGNPLPAAAARLVALRKPDGAAEALLGYLPFAEADTMTAEVEAALAAVALRDGKPDPAVLRALDDPLAPRRAAAAEALCRAGGQEHAPAVSRLLRDPDLRVRLRVASALASARDKEAVPVLIDLVRDLPADQSWEAQEVLLRIAGERAPAEPPGDDGASRRKARDAWAAWWKENAARADLSRVGSGQPVLGYTLVCLVENNGMGRVVELGRDGKVRWQVEGLQYPVDAYVLPGNRVLVAEYNGRKVTERDLKGRVLWEKGNFSAMLVNAQRLANGHTFIATQNQLLEVDRAGKEVFSHHHAGNIWAAAKAANGQITFLSGSECVRLDASGKELKRFNVNAAGNWTSGIDLPPHGRVLVAQHQVNRVAEFDADGKEVWHADAPQITTATRLANGHTLVASYSNDRVFELDKAGKVVWEHKDTLHPFRARRR